MKSIGSWVDVHDGSGWRGEDVRRSSRRRSRWWFCGVAFLAAAPVDEQAVAQTPEHSDDPQGLGQAHAAWVVAVRDIPALVQAAFDAPGGAVKRQPLGGLQVFGQEAGDEHHGFRGVLAQVRAQQGDLLDAGKAHRLGAAGAGTQDAPFGLAFVELTLAGQRRGGRARGENPPAGRQRVFRCGSAAGAGCL